MFPSQAWYGALWLLNVVSQHDAWPRNVLMCVHSIAAAQTLLATSIACIGLRTDSFEALDT